GTQVDHDVGRHVVEVEGEAEHPHHAEDQVPAGAGADVHANAIGRGHVEEESIVSGAQVDPDVPDVGVGRGHPDQAQVHQVAAAAGADIQAEAVGCRQVESQRIVAGAQLHADIPVEIVRRGEADLIRLAEEAHHVVTRARVDAREDGQPGPRADRQ